MSDTFQITYQNNEGSIGDLTGHGSTPDEAIADIAGFVRDGWEPVAAQEIVYDDDGAHLTGEVIHLPL